MSSWTFRSFALSLIVCGSWSAPASAFDGEPLCAYPPNGRLAYRFTPFERITAAMCAGTASHGDERDAHLGPPDARRAFERAARLAERGREADAVLHLSTVRRAFPRLADLVDLEEARIRMRTPDRRACDAFARAAQSVNRTIAAQASIGRARCLLAIGDRRGVEAVSDLRRRYPELPYAQELDLALARAHERWNDRAEAVRRYRELDLMYPGSPSAAEARGALARLAQAGVEVREPTALQLVERADRLARSGPHDYAREEIDRLRASGLPRTLAQQVARSAARIARVEGRWADAEAFLREAQGLPTLDPEERAEIEEQARDLSAAAETTDADEVRREIRALTRGRPLRTVPTNRLFTVLRMAARAGLREEVNGALDALLRIERLPPGLRFEAGILAAGTGDDAKVAQLFAGARSHPSFGVAARYHHGRALERLGRITEAREEFARVIGEDDPRLPYYALWARLRLRETTHVGTRTPEPIALLDALDCAEVAPDSEDGKGGRIGGQDQNCVAPTPPNPYPSAPSTEDAEAVDAEVDPLAEEDARAVEAELASDGRERPQIDLTDAQIAAALAPIAEAHAEGLPWIARARDLVLLGRRHQAAEELHEAYSAWTASRGGGTLNAGLLAVFRGSAPPRPAGTPAQWQNRRRLSNDARRTLARISAALGDHGLAIRFDGGFSIAGPRPRAYEQIVEAAAERHGLEPELLFAVMRVESVYNPRIISYAGAIGLMQIMPRTGRLIANALGRDDFTVDRLLDPELNIEFAAWYLSSLIRRFDGRVPLAIASYNGGPHNVRRWMRDHSDDMPVDAFLERIPFDQTHRYVRRVLTHYAAYRAQRSRPVMGLETRLPEERPDAVAF